VARQDSSAPDLDAAVVRICPACGVVNPAGPSEGCPHLQLVRFDGIGAELSELLADLARARRRFADLSALLKQLVMDAVRDGRAEVEATRKARASELESVTRLGEKASLALTPTEPPEAAKQKPRPRRKRRGPPPVDPRQLDLLAQSPPKGDA
jgi:hypothetical protein